MGATNSKSGAHHARPDFYTSASQGPDRPGGIRALIIGLAVIAAMVLGGGGSPSPAPELLLQLVLIALFAAWWWYGGSLQVAEPAGWRIALLLLALPLVQLMPLPPAIWHMLPGRAAEQAGLALVGANARWQPWSVAPARTLAALLALLPALALMLMTASLDRAGRGLVVALIAGCGLVELVAGAGQLGGGTANPFAFYGEESRVVTGFEANRNHAADVMIVAMVAFAATMREMALRRSRAGRGEVTPLHLPLLAGITALFSLGCVLTASRAGIALLPLGWLAVLVIAWPWLRSPLPAGRKLPLLLGGVVAIAAATFLLLRVPGIARVAARFSFTTDFRVEIWRDSFYAAQNWFPFGSGMGTFATVFPAAERLEMVDTLTTNRAHDELLELAIEGGVVALALALVVAVLVGRRLITAWRDPPAGSRAQVVFAGATLAVIALHSQVDYPLRAMSLECLAGVAGGLLLAASGPGVGRGQKLPTAKKVET